MHMTDTSVHLDDDATLVQATLAGRVDCFEQLVRRYNQRFFRAARAQLGDDFEAEDVTQQAWLSIYGSLRQWSGRGSFWSWALTVVFNLCRRRRPELQQNEELTLEEPSSSPGPDDEAQRTQARELLEQSVDALSPSLRTVLVLRDVEGLSSAEAGAALGLSEEAVRVRLFRARRAVQASLDAMFEGEARALYPFLGARCNRITEHVMREITPV